MASWIFWYNSNYFHGQVPPPLVNHGLSMGGSKSHNAAVMLANLPLCLWLLVNTTTAQHCSPAFSFSVSTEFSTVLSSPTGSQAAIMWFREAQRSSLEGQHGWSLPGALSPNLKPWSRVFCSQTAVHCLSTREHWGERFLLPLSFAESILKFPQQDLLQAPCLPNSSGFWPLFSSCAEVSPHPLLLTELGSSSIALSLDRDLPSFSWTTRRLSFSFYQSHIVSVFVTPRLLPYPLSPRQT